MYFFPGVFGHMLRILFRLFYEKIHRSKSVEKTNVKNLKALDMSIKKDTPASKLQIENAVLRTENKELKEQVAKLRKALQNLM